MASAEHLAAVGTIRNSEATKFAIIQMALSGKSYSEIAKEMGVKRGVVSGVVYRARRALVASPAPVKAPPQVERCNARSQKRVRLVEIAASADWQPRPVHITDARDGQCRWALWGADAPFSEKLVCGLPAKRGQSYCAHCYGLSYDNKFTRDIDRKLGTKHLARFVR